MLISAYKAQRPSSPFGILDLCNNLINDSPSDSHSSLESRTTPASIPADPQSLMEQTLDAR